jgi:peroxiredoxin
MSELQGLQLRASELRSLGAEVVAVCVDPPERNAEVRARLRLDFPILSDPQAEAIRAFGVLHAGGGPSGEDIARPGVFLIEHGQIRWRDLTPNWRVRIHPEQLLQAARETFTAARPSSG